MEITQEDIAGAKSLILYGSISLIDKDFALKFNKDELEFIMTNYIPLLELCSPQLKNDKDIALAFLKTSAYNFQFLSDNLKDDKDIALTALNYTTNVFKYLSPKLRDDDDIINFTLKSSPREIEHASDRIKNDKPLIMNLLNIDSTILTHIHEDLKNDIDVMFKYWEIIEKQSNKHMFFKSHVKFLLSNMSTELKSCFGSVDFNLHDTIVSNQMVACFNKLILKKELDESLNLKETIQVKRPKL